MVVADLDIARLEVYVGDKKVGMLAQTQAGPVAFQYDAEWLESGYSLNPFSLPLEASLFIARPHPLDGLFGVFDDSLPDGWGRLLVDRMLHERGVDPFAISPLARLAIVGQSGMGALEYQPEVSLLPQTKLRDLDELASECSEMLQTDFSDDLDTLYALGGSSGGACPKIFTQIDGEDWIVKFPSSHDPQDIGVREFEIAQMAKACGIDMPEVRLMPSRACGGYFAIKRFDRIAKGERTEKVHMASAGALLETSHRIPSLDYDLLMKLTLRLTDSMADVEAMCRLMVFNVLIGNRDDHAKNFSFLYANGRWRLSPAYDLTQNEGINGEHSTTVNGKGKNITREDLLTVGLRAGLSRKTCECIFEEVVSTVG